MDSIVVYSIKSNNGNVLTKLENVYKVEKFNKEANAVTTTTNQIFKLDEIFITNRAEAYYASFKEKDSDVIFNKLLDTLIATNTISMKRQEDVINALKDLRYSN